MSPALGRTQPRIQWRGGALPGVKRPEREVDSSCPPSVEVIE